MAELMALLAEPWSVNCVRVVRLRMLHRSNTKNGYNGTAEYNPNSKSNSKVQKRQGSRCMMQKEIYRNMRAHIMKNNIRRSPGTVASAVG